MRKIFYILTSVAIAACAAHKPAPSDGDIQTASVDDTRLFATSLFSAVNALSFTDNICISPSSAGWALAMTANGARGNTAEQIYGALGYAGGEEERAAFNALQKKNIEELVGSEEAKIGVANSIWVDKKTALKKSFIEDNAKFYGATVKNNSFDVEGIKEINSWCSDKTEGKITSILNDAAPSTRLLLINALYFKARWMRPFEKGLTREASFTKADGEKTTVQMMRQSLIAPYYEDSIMQATSRIFEGGDFSMILVLPQKWSSVEEAVARFLEVYNSNFPGERSRTCTVQLAMPKFKHEFGTSLKPMLEKMGVTDAFTERADFGGISKTPLLIDDVIQKTYIAVDEAGAEAAAVTAVQMVGMSARPIDKQTMTLDRPFIYTITNNHTGEILFIGKVGNPEF